MRTLGLCASLLAAAHVVLASAPAFAAPPAGAPTTQPSKRAKPAKPAKKPKKADKSDKSDTTAAPAPTPPPAPEPPAPPPAPPAQPEVGKTTLTSADVAARPAADEKAAPKDAPQASAADGLVEVHIDSPRAVTLEKRTGGSWEAACTSPCDKPLPVTPEYRVVGESLNESRAFMLDASGGKVTLRVDPGSQSTQRTGVWVIVGSGAVIAGGVVVILLGASKHADAMGMLPQSSTNAIFGGGAMALAGVVGGLVGGALIVNNAHTGVAGNISHTTSEKGGPAKPELNLSARASAMNTTRQPTWNAPRTEGVPQVVNVPVFGGTF